LRQRKGSPRNASAAKAQTLLERGLACKSKGQLNEALRCLDKVLRTDPTDSRALFAKGQILAEQQNFPRLLFALDQYDAPARADAVLSYVIAYYYFRLSRYEKALQHLERAVKLNPSYAIAHLLMAEIYHETGKREESLGALSNLPPEAVRSGKEIRSHADVLIKLGLHDEALALLQGLLRDDSMAVQAIDTITGLPGEYWPDRLEAQIDRHLNNSRTSPEDRVRLHFAAGRLLDSQGSFDRAFAHFQRANSLSRQDFEPEVVRDCVSTLKQVFDGGSQDGAQQPETGTVTPVFIVGLPSAGKTTLETALRHHPHIEGAGERGLRTYIHEDIFVGVDGRAPRTLRSSLRDLSAARKKQYAQGYLDTVLSSLMREERPKFLVNTLPMNFWNCGVINRIFPDAKFIHMQRNKMDVCWSNYTRHFDKGYNFANNFSSLADYWKLYEEMSSHWRQYLSGHWLDVSYESLVTDPSGTVAAVCGFLGLPCEGLDAKREAIGNALTGHHVGRWMNYERQLEPLIEALGPRA
jgi:tetratricopeptide (TPR) repeat protein